jgi:glycogen synthase
VRICFVSRRFFPAISGMSVYAANLLKELVAAGHDVTMISQYRDDAFGRGVYGGGPPPPVDGVKVIGLEALGEQEGGAFERDIEAMVEIIAREHDGSPFDILHAQYGYPNGWAVLLAGRALGVPNLVSIQGGDGHWVGSCCETHRLAMSRVLDHAGAVLIGGPSFAYEVHERLGTPLERFSFVPGAVDVARFTPGPRRQEESLRVLYHGRVDRRKGVLDFISALARLSDRPWTATVSGIGPDLDEARALAGTLLPGRIRFAGYVDYAAAPAIYREHNLFVSPTYGEGFSNTILEAMASGLAVISCSTTGVVDCIRDGENGLLVEPADVAGLATAIAGLIDDPNRLTQLAEVALAEARERYSWHAVGRQVMRTYARLEGTRSATEFDPDLPIHPCRFRQAPHLL